jgi:SAM-dependent methyltransferase
MPEDDERRRLLAATFDASAAFYDDVRPGYPPELFDDLVRLAGLRADARVLEIGCGTGKASVPLARRGFRLTCLEPGANLAAVARSQLRPYPLVEVLDARLEDFLGEEGAFDLVMAATSIAWVDPAVRYAKPAALLRTGGSMAVFWNAHVLPADGDSFWIDVQEVYARYTPNQVGEPPPPADLPASIPEDMRASGLFEEVAVRHYPWNETYDAARYVALMRTFSGHIALPDDLREPLIADVARMIDERFGGRITKHHVAVLQVARRRA